MAKIGQATPRHSESRTSLRLTMETMIPRLLIIEQQVFDNFDNAWMVLNRLLRNQSISLSSPTTREGAQARTRFWENNHKKTKCILPSPKNCSLPDADDKALVDLARFENQCRTISEMVLLLIFSRLPYCTVPYSSAFNLLCASNKERGLPLKCISRVFPKGTLSLPIFSGPDELEPEKILQKPLHDDENGSLSPPYGLISLLKRPLKLSFSRTPSAFRPSVQNIELFYSWASFPIGRIPRWLMMILA